VLKERYVPVVMVSPEDDPACAMEAMDLGAFNSQLNGVSLYPLAYY
jgi:hypothetical protein